MVKLEKQWENVAAACSLKMQELIIRFWVIEVGNKSASKVVRHKINLIQGDKRYVHSYASETYCTRLKDLPMFKKSVANELEGLSI